MKAMQKTIYLDYAATTPMDSRVAESMQPFLTGEGNYANASAILYPAGREAFSAVEKAREQVAQLIHAQAEEIIFTSGATESINLAIKGIMSFYRRKGKHLITCATEHKATLKTCEALEKLGVDVTYLKPLSSGLIDLSELEKAIRTDTVLVSLMHVNNEIGVIHDIEAIAKITQKHRVFLHVDAVQSVGRLPVNVQQTAIDLLSISAHKLYGPKGIGALYIKHGIHLTPLIHGGAQERGLRAGTLAVPQIVGMGQACDIALACRAKDFAHEQRLRELFLARSASIKNMFINGCSRSCIPHIINVSFDGVDITALLELLTPHLAISTGAACATGQLEPSYILRALGVSISRAQNALRFSWGRETRAEDIEQAVIYLKEALNFLGQER